MTERVPYRQAGDIARATARQAGNNGATPAEMQVLLGVILLTASYSKTADRTTLGEIAAASGLYHGDPDDCPKWLRRKVSTRLQRLADLGAITYLEGGKKGPGDRSLIILKGTSPGSPSDDDKGTQPGHPSGNGRGPLSGREGDPSGVAKGTPQRAQGDLSRVAKGTRHGSPPRRLRVTEEPSEKDRAPQPSHAARANNTNGRTDGASQNAPPPPPQLDPNEPLDRILFDPEIISCAERRPEAIRALGDHLAGHLTERAQRDHLAEHVVHDAPHENLFEPILIARELGYRVPDLKLTKGTR